MKKRAVPVIIVLFAMLIGAILLDLSWAARPLSVSEVIDVLTGNGTWANNLIVKKINSPRIVGAIFVGAGLAVSGTVMQAVFRNPMASPYILGLSSGASLGAALGILFSFSFIPSVIQIPFLAFVFCMLTMMLVYSLSKVGGNVHVETLLLAGIAVNSMLSAMVSFLTLISGDKIEGIVFWSLGSLASIGWDELCIIVPVVSCCILMLMFFTRSLNAMMIGDDHAMDLGIDLKKTRLAVLIITTVLTAISVAFVGAIGFVGLIIPHIFRLLLGPDNRLLLPVVAFGGATFLLVCDFISRSMASIYGVLPIGIITALIGAPYFIYLVRRRRRDVGW
ncbi:MAG: iron ABC transporter permease [Candidatus Methanomethylophilus sp.]|nr:iron ABC transporter permease [Methanomethylophilus sp.]MDD4222145.1 iron ABC transporter permease [Methanomethylophilus sp.]